MIDIQLLSRKIKSTAHDGKLYLSDKISDEIGLFIMNGDFLYIVSNSEQSSTLCIETEYLNISTNVHISSFDNDKPSFPDGIYDIVKLNLANRVDVENNLDAFVNLCVSHAIYKQGKDLVQFFDSLVLLFQLPREQQFKNLVGFVGELAVIKYLIDQFEVDISSCWHTRGSNSKLDFVCENANIEVKTTSSESLEFEIKHNQLFDTPEKNFLSAVVLVEDNSGFSLNDLIDSLLESKDYCNSFEFVVNIEKEKRKVSPKDLYEKKFRLKNIYLYKASEINQLGSIPACISDMHYKLNLLPFEPIPIKSFISLIKS